MDKQTSTSIEDFFGSSIIAYTREQALSDGVLIDVSKMGAEAGLRPPVAVTSAVFKQYIEWTDEDSKKQSYQDQSSRLWDALLMARFKITSAVKQNSNESLFELDCIPRDGKSTRAKLTVLKVHIGPGDQGEAVLTIMLPNED